VDLVIENDDENCITITEENNNNSNIKICNMSKQLEESISKTLAPSKIVSDDEYRVLSKEISIYEATGNITENLKTLMEVIMTIKTTSTENERNFSVSNNFASKLRGRLTDKHLNCLCFLKNYFQKHEK